MYKNIIADAAPRCKPSTRPKPQPPLWQNAGNRPGAAQTPCRTRERHFKAGQSLRHGLRPCHLPLTREAKLRPGGKAAALRDRTPCRGRCLHRPGRPCGGANVPGRDKSRPYGPRRTPGQPGRPRLPGQTQGGMPSSRRTLRRRPPPCRTRERHFKAGQSLRHGLRPCHLPLTREANLRQSCAQAGRLQLCVIATPVGDDACIVPGDPAAAPTSPGGINPAPTAHGERPANRDGHGCPDKRRVGCPHPARPRGGALLPAAPGSGISRRGNPSVTACGRATSL